MAIDQHGPGAEAAPVGLVQLEKLWPSARSSCTGVWSRRRSCCFQSESCTDALEIVISGKDLCVLCTIIYLVQLVTRGIIFQIGISIPLTLPLLPGWYDNQHGICYDLTMAGVTGHCALPVSDCARHRSRIQLNHDEPRHRKEIRTDRVNPIFSRRPVRPTA